MTRKFTKKETLLLEAYRLENEYCSLNSEPAEHDIDSMLEFDRFYGESRHYTVYELEERIKSAKRSIEKLLKAQEIDAYFQTAEGKAEKEELEAGIELKKQELKDCETYYEDVLKTWIADFLGSHWTLYYLWNSRVEFTIKQEGEEDKRVFGSMIEVSFDEQGRFKDGKWIKTEKFELNVGSMGAFDIQATSTDSRARFYIDLGKFLANAEKTAELRKMLFEFRSTIEAIRTELNQLNDRLENPTNL